MNRFLWLLVGCFGLILASIARGESVIYTNDFENGAGAEWSQTTTDVTPVGARRYLGQFFNDTVTLTLPSIAALHDALRISFDLYIIRSWDGNNAAKIPGEVADVWEFGVDGSTALVTTFDANPFDPDHDRRQAYPDSYPGGDFLAGTGAAELDTLGYFHPVRLDYPQSAVYSMTFRLPHANSSAVLSFLARQLEPDILDESWGIDNVRVAAVPEPSTLLTGFVGIAAIAISHLIARKSRRRIV